MPVESATFTILLKDDTTAVIGVVPSRVEERFGRPLVAGRGCGQRGLVSDRVFAFFDHEGRQGSGEQ